MKKIIDDFIFDNNINFIGLNNELKAIYCYELYKKTNKGCLFVANSLYDANLFYQYLSNYTDNILLFPMDDFLTSEVLAASPELKIKRLETLAQLIKDNNYIVVTNLMGYLRYLPTKTEFARRIVNLKTNLSIKFSDLVDKLIDNGYEKQTIVGKTGDFAVRGFVIDIYPISFDNPVRIEFFGDEIEDIRLFDVNNQLSIKK